MMLGDWPVTDGLVPDIVAKVASKGECGDSWGE